MKLSSFACALVLLSSLLTSGAADFTISQPSIATDSTATVSYRVTGLSTGESVRFDRFADYNGNGVVDPGEPLMRRFFVTDGLVPLIGGVRNLNVPGDDDGSANGAIRVDLKMRTVEPILNLQPGKYLVRATIGGSEIIQPFEITAPNLAQKITGVVRNSANNAAISNAWVVALVGDGSPIGSVRSDVSGAFTLVGQPAKYGLVAISDGYVGTFAQVDLTAGVNKTQDMLLTPAPIRISGHVSDNLGENIPAVFVLGQSDSDSGSRITGGLTSGSGAYSFGVTAGNWEIKPIEQFVAQLGLVGPDKGPQLTINADKSVDHVLNRATALIYGHVADTTTAAIANLEMRAGLQNGNSSGAGVTSTNGDYTIATLAGNWNLETDNAQSLGVQGAGQLISVAAGQAVRADFSLRHTTAHLRGRVVDSLGNGIAGVFFHGHFENDFNGSSGESTAEDGSFDIAVWGGSWYFHIGDDAQARSLIDHQVFLTIVDGVDQEITFVVPTSTATISGLVYANGTSQPLANIQINGTMTVNGTNFTISGATDAVGHYQLPAVNGSWNLSFDCNAFSQLGFNCPGSRTVVVNNANAVANFTVFPPARPTIEAPQYTSNSDFRFTLRGDPGVYAIYGATNVAATSPSWIFLGTAPILTGQSTGLAVFNPAGNKFFQVKRQ